MADRSALSQFLPQDFPYTDQEVAGLWAEGASDPDGWPALMNTYASLGQGSLQQGLRKGSSAVRKQSKQYARALNETDKMNAFEKARLTKLVDTFKNFVPDPNWRYTNHEAPNLYVEQAKAAGMAPRPYMEQRVLPELWNDVDLSAGQQFGQQVYYPKKERKATGRQDVYELQNALNQSGARIPADGKLGPKTAAAVKAFQARMGLKPDGIVGPKTRAALKLQAVR